MVTCNGNMVVTYYTKPGTTKLITMDGKELWTVNVDESGQELFSFPRSIQMRRKLFCPRYSKMFMVKVAVAAAVC